MSGMIMDNGWMMSIGWIMDEAMDVVMGNITEVMMNAIIMELMDELICANVYGNGYCNVCDVGYEDIGWMKDHG